MKASKVWMLAVVTFAICAVPSRAADERRDAQKEKAGKVIDLDSVKPEESESRSKLEEPNFGYEGHLGTFEVTMKSPSGHAPTGLIVVHQYPYHEKTALGRTKLKFVGARRIGNVDGWVFETDWDGKQYPSKIFVHVYREFSFTPRLVSAQQDTGRVDSWRFGRGALPDRGVGLGVGG